MPNRVNTASGIAALVLAVCAAWPARAATITILGTATAGGYTFTNFDLPNAGTNAGAGTNINGIANNGAAAGVSIDNAGNFSNFVSNPIVSSAATGLGLGPHGMAFGINSAGNVVGTDGNGNAIYIPSGGLPKAVPVTGATSATAFGINDHGNIVGQYTNAGGATPGFYVTNSTGAGLITVNAPSGPNPVNDQGVNNHGLMVGFYVGTNGQDHGFTADTSAAILGSVTGTAVADPTIPPVAGEPGATFVFSQILGVNDHGLAIGYYGDSTTSQHGFFYNTAAGTYNFLDDPAEAFNNGVEVTQITGINNIGEISGFYSDANGVFHGFVACPVGVNCAAVATVAEPGSLTLLGLGLVALGFGPIRTRRGTPAAG